MTGASSGIGRAFVLGLARAGLSVALSARRVDRLEALAEECRALGVEARVFPADLARPDGPRRLVEAARAGGLRIRLLCNAAGVDAWGAFETLDWEAQRDMMRLNMEAPAALCHLLKEDLKAGGVAINVASQAAYQPVPYMAAYAASKAFLARFSAALHGEWTGEGILVQTLLPGPTDTDIPSLAALKKRGLVPKLQTPAMVVETSLRHIDRGTLAVDAGPRPIHHRFFAAVLPLGVLVKAIAGKFRPAPGKEPAGPSSTG